MYENPNEETELKWKKYINAETGQLYDLVAVGTGAWSDNFEPNICHMK
jgi:hypothetical protein